MVIILHAGGLTQSQRERTTPVANDYGSIAR
jgi:hypothetical protein